jgi:hypothetical protein
MFFDETLPLSIEANVYSRIRDYGILVIALRLHRITLQLVNYWHCKKLWDENSIFIYNKKFNYCSN